MLAVQERERRLLSLLARNGYRSFEKTKILEVGCGTGAWLREFIKWGARPENILGIDLLSERISEARMLCPAAVRLKCNSAAQLGEPNATFDLVLQSTVFTSILDAELKRQIASEMLRVLNLEGAIIWYDFRFDNPKNPDVHGIEKNEIADLFPECRVVLHRLTLAPPIGRPMGNLSPALYRVLSCIKPLCTHYLGIITRK